MQILRSAASKQSVSGLIKGKESKLKYCPGMHVNGKLHKLIK